MWVPRNEREMKPGRPGKTQLFTTWTVLKWMRGDNKMLTVWPNLKQTRIRTWPCNVLCDGDDDLIIIYCG